MYTVCRVYSQLQLTRTIRHRVVQQLYPYATVSAARWPQHDTADVTVTSLLSRSLAHLFPHIARHVNERPDVNRRVSKIVLAERKEEGASVDQAVQCDARGVLTAQ